MLLHHSSEKHLQTLPVVFVVAGPGHRDHHGAVEGQHHSAQAPAATSALICKALKLSRQVEGREAEPREGNWRGGMGRGRGKEKEEKLIMCEY